METKMSCPKLSRNIPIITSIALFTWGYIDKPITNNFRNTHDQTIRSRQMGIILEKN